MVCVSVRLAVLCAVCCVLCAVCCVHQLVLGVSDKTRVFSKASLSAGRGVLGARGNMRAAECCMRRKPPGGLSMTWW
jgi:hypothetical protein